ncbi:putative xaa-pro dipeptidase [Rosellinia necatrix]|uniref:Xaa-Pro aminopeptidase n=1 Tax=Rosellinia necatrix TaxID=77044 RepID=A0A1S8AAG7_ROSNE|nr:putative xaa-pro dipeptidase [Rosellinia necatrix]
MKSSRPPLRQLQKCLEPPTRRCHFQRRPISTPSSQPVRRPAQTRCPQTSRTTRTAKTTTRTGTTRSICSSISSISSSRAYATSPVPASQLLFGQPTHETHPHLLKPGELTPGITAQEHHLRRAALMARLPAGSAVVLPAAELRYRSGAVFYPFRQESNFLYLTGFAEPESLAVLRKLSDGDYRFYLLCRSKDPAREQWNGPWSGVDAARDVWNADETGDIADPAAALAGAFDGVTVIYSDAARSPHGASEVALRALLKRCAPHILSYEPLRPHVNELRAIKSPAEIANMRRAGQLSGRALTAAMRREWASEKDLAAFLEYEYQTSGLDGHAYVPVVAGGPRGLLIHYVLNQAALVPGETVLVDAGGEYGTYITDITRTWPVSGKFTAAQRDLYGAVLNVQRSVVSLCRASANMTLDDLQGVTERGLAQELGRLGFALGRGGAMRVLFPHHVGHYVGLDVHDIPGYPRSVVLREGHCVTVEPGIYVPDADDDRFPAHFRGMAVRIEDSVAVGDDNPLILTTEAVKEVADIEALRD